MFFGLPVISVAIWLPIMFGILVLATGDDKNAPLARILALVGSVLGFLVTLPLYTGFVRDTSEMQFVEMHNWIARFNIHYHLGVDGISVLFILLTSFFTPIVVLAGWQVIEKRVAQYMASFLIMSGIMIGVFAALDAILFYVFWEAMLIPMFLIIGVWGGANRVYAAVKFFLYTLLGSLLMLVALIYLYNQTGWQLRDTRFPPGRDPDDCADPDLHRVFLRLRREGADVPGAYLVAGCARRSAHRRLGDPGGDHAEGGRLRFPALLHTHRARCQPSSCPG